MPIVARGLACLTLALTIGCSGANDGDVSVASTADMLTCQTLTVQSGHIGSGQGPSALATAQLTGTRDVWKDYVEFAPATSATCSFALPAGVAVSGITGLALGLNYRGPSKSNMTWSFDAWDAVAGTWVPVGDNGFAGDWVWTAGSLPLPGSVARFFSGNVLKVRYSSASTVDASQLDQWVVKVSHAAPGDMALPPPPPPPPGDMTTTPPPPPPPGDMAPTSGRWQPQPGTTWQWQLTGTIDTSVVAQVYDIDLFDNSAATIASLKSAGHKVVCYFSAGTYENWRPDASSFPAAVIGSGVQGWPGENWLDTRAQVVRDILSKRMDMAAQKGCDGVEPDNVDGYTNKPGFPLTAQTQLDFNQFLANAAHARNLSVALKNDLDQVAALVPYFDFALNEQCFQYSECDTLQPFIAANKAVFEVEYGAASLATSVCPKAKSLRFDTLIKNLDLDAWRVSCD